ncbi:hypothetical protein [Ornithinimicrobium kibberense]|uniref:hypothetical protein n=1 Tax=Ornithinimicrobium kibberense TaxID=282060 RepID=UPI00360BC154
MSLAGWVLRMSSMASTVGAAGDPRISGSPAGASCTSAPRGRRWCGSGQACAVAWGPGTSLRPGTPIAQPWVPPATE